MSIENLFSGITYEEQYKAQQRAKDDAENKKRADLLLATFGIPFSEMRLTRPEVNGRISATRDGSVHYIHDPTRKLYRYVYAFGPHKWVSEDSRLVK